MMLLIFFGDMLVMAFMIAVVVWLSRIPGSSLTTPAVPGWLVVGACVVLVLWIVAERLQVGGYVVAVAALLLAVAAAWRLAPPAPGDTLRLRVLAVGHGAAHVVSLPNGRTLIYDMGSMPPYDLEQWAVGPVLAHDRIARIDAAVVSHANLDHFCGLPDLAEHRPVGWLVSSPYFFQKAESPGSTAKLFSEMRRLGVRTGTLARGDRLVGTSDATADVLWPPGNLSATTEANDTSVVLRLQYAGRRILLCGDIETLPQQELVASADLKADVLVLPHHGSPKHLAPEFLRAVDPLICICSNGRRDSDSPNGVRSMLAGRRYYNTADVGAVTVSISPAAIHVYCGADDTPICTLSNR